MSFLYVKVFQNIFCVCRLLNKELHLTDFHFKGQDNLQLLLCTFDLKEQLLSKSQKMLLSWNLILTKDCCSRGSKFLFTLLSSHTYSLKELRYL